MLHPAVRTPTIYFTALPLMRLLLVLAVVLSFAQRQVHAQPPLLRFSTPALALILASEFVQAQPPEFEVVGDGACLDCGAGDGNDYDYIDFENGNGATFTSQDECESLCVACASEVSSSNPNREFRGFVWVPSFLFCTCYFDDDSVDFTNECQNMSTCSGAASPISYESDRSGNGVMCSSSGNPLSECSKLTAPFPSNYVPAECPSSVPSTSPSTTHIPSISTSPSSSSMPSESPSDAPSTLPSDDPSSSPSEQPSVSLAPSESSSDLPSNQPSDSTSTEPSSEQSSTPSCSPSNSPTESPSVTDGINLFYPDWAKGGETCRNDGDHPDYMEINPTEWLSSSLDACCKKFFGGFLYKQCIGAYPPDADDCNLMLYYPDWDGNGANEGCLDDGKEPLYMLGNAQYFLSNSIEECCEKFYEWNFYECSGTTPELTHGEFYPDWSGGGSTCLADGKIPDYMISNQNWYLSTTLEKCCERHFYWNINECLGTTSVGSNDWYVSYEDVKCVQDCSGAEPCGGVAEPWDKLYSTKEKCCKEKLPWVPKCRFN